MKNAKHFFEKFLIPNFEEWAAHPVDERRAMNAVLSLNQMADWHFVESINDPINVGCTTSPGKYRDYLVNKECPEFQLIWDVADAHKHFKLKRSSAVVSSAEQLGVHRTGYVEDGYWDDDYVEDWDELIVELDDGKVVTLMKSAQLVLKMWGRLL